MTRKSVSNKLLRVLLSVGFLLFVIHLGLQYLNIVVHYQQVGSIYELSNRFDFDDEASVPTWFSQLLYLNLSIMAFLAAYLQTEKFKKIVWLIIGLAGILFSIDEIAGLHEYMLQQIHVHFFEDSAATGSDNAWLVVVPFLIIMFISLIWMSFKTLPKRTVILFVISGLLVSTGAIFIDLMAVVEERETFFNQGVIVVAEELLEVLGVIIAVYATADYLERYHNKAIRSSVRALRGGKNQD